jgi:hypothetical protein
LNYKSDSGDRTRGFAGCWTTPQIRFTGTQTHSGGSNEFASMQFINSTGLSFKTLQALG